LRYQLRLLFWPAPPRLCSKDSGYETRSKRHSQVNKKIVMSMPQKGAEEIDHDRLAALFNTGLDYMCEHFSMEALVSKPPLFILRVDFCDSKASQRTIPENGVVELSHSELDQICIDIDEASTVLAATNACKFLQQLLSLPSVQEGIKRQGGWQAVETYAKYSRDYELWKLCPEDKHLVVLCNYTSFYKILGTAVKLLKDPSMYARQSLDALKKRFRLDYLRSRDPQIQKVAECLDEHLSHASKFPTVQEAP
jgi:hypothetical protein